MIYSRTTSALPNSNGRIIRYVFSTPVVARDQHTIQAWRLDNFRLNPVFLWAHQGKEPPVGKVVEVDDDKGYLTGSVEYAERDVYPFADTVFQMVRGGFLNAVSTSWDPIEWKFTTDRSRPGGIDFKLVDLLELSQVPVPALPTAVATARSAGIDVSPMIGWAERALDERNTTMPRTALQNLRRAAGAPRAVPARSIDRGEQFHTFGDQLLAACRACAGETVDARLVRAPTGMGEVDPSGGGFVVDTQSTQQIIASAYGTEAVLAPLTDRRETAAPLGSVKVPGIDETSRATGSRWGGVLGYWSAEGDQITASSLKYRGLEFSAKKMVIAVVVTNELLSDAPMLGAHVKMAAAAELGFMIDWAILRGDGAGKPLGFLNSPALVTIAKEAGQASGTILAENVRKMWSRMPAPSRRRAVWLVCEDAEEALEQMTIVTGTSGAPAPTASALYMPAGASGNQTALLKGRPVYPIEQASQLGTLGDIVLADLSSYILVDGGLNAAMSVHVKFLTDETIFRFTLRVDGQSAYASPITPYNGSTNKRSPFVALAAR